MTGSADYPRASCLKDKARWTVLSFFHHGNAKGGPPTSSTKAERLSAASPAATPRLAIFCFARRRSDWFRRW